MCSDFVTAGALGGIRGSLRRVASDLEQQNRTVSSLAQQVQVANHWQVTAFKLQKEVADWKAWGVSCLEGWKKEEQVTADLRQQLEQAQNSIAHWKRVGDDRVEAAIQGFAKGMGKLETEWLKEKKVSDDLREKLSSRLKKYNMLVECLNTINAQPADAVALIAALKVKLADQKA